MATRDGWGTTERHSLSARQPNGAPDAVQEDTAAVTKLLLVCLIDPKNQSESLRRRPVL
jgi:hypothetical protein